VDYIPQDLPQSIQSFGGEGIARASSRMLGASCRPWRTRQRAGVARTGGSGRDVFTRVLAGTRGDVTARSMLEARDLRVSYLAPAGAVKAVPRAILSIERGGDGGTRRERAGLAAPEV
jgi:hypothetical protein